MSTIDDAFPKSPDQIRQEKTIEWLHCLHKEMSLMNKNLAIVGQALLRQIELTAKANMAKIVEDSVVTLVKPKKGAKDVKQA